MTIEIFKTNVGDENQAAELTSLLLAHFPGCRINIDMHDCDKILRVEGIDFSAEKVMLLVNTKGVVCSILD